MSRSRPFTAVLLGATLVLAGCADDGADDAGGEAAPGGSSIAVTGNDDLSWSSEQLSADAGTIEVELTCEPGVNHNFEVDGEVVAECEPGETATGAIDLAAGEYEFICSVPGHEERMRGTLTVS